MIQVRSGIKPRSVIKKEKKKGQLHHKESQIHRQKRCTKAPEKTTANRSKRRSCIPCSLPHILLRASVRNDKQCFTMPATTEK